MRIVEPQSLSCQRTSRVMFTAHLALCVFTHQERTSWRQSPHPCLAPKCRAARICSHWGEAAHKTATRIFKSDLCLLHPIVKQLLHGVRVCERDCECACVVEREGMCVCVRESELVCEGEKESERVRV
jgi:hypothetical protein